MSILFGILIFVRPLVGIITIAWMIGIYAIVFGVLLIGLSLRLRREGRHLAELPKG